MVWVSSFRQHVVDARALLPRLEGKTLRVRHFNRISGRGLRVTFTNPFNSETVSLSGLTIRYQDQLYPLCFMGSPTLRLAGEQSSTSDVLHLPILADSTIEIIYTVREGAFHGGQYGLLESWMDDRPLRANAGLCAIEVESDEAQAIIAFGDSFTHQGQWLDSLAASFSNVAGINLGISGNQLLGDPKPVYYGEPMNSRFMDDVSDLSGVRILLFQGGLNDFILSPGVDLEWMKKAMLAIRDTCDARHWPILMGTLTPFSTSAYYHDELETKRLALNHWLRTSIAEKQLVDYDGLLKDHQNSHRLAADYDRGDGLHINSSGADLVSRFLHGKIADRP